MIYERECSLKSVLHLVHIILVMPVAIAQVERQFSCIKRILGYSRLSLALQSVDAILRISVDGPEMEKLPPNRVVEHWYLSGRNPDTSLLKESFNMIS